MARRLGQMPRLLRRDGGERIRATCRALQRVRVARRVSWLPEIDIAFSAWSSHTALNGYVPLGGISFNLGSRYSRHAPEFRARPPRGCWLPVCLTYRSKQIWIVTKVWLARNHSRRWIPKGRAL